NAKQHEREAAIVAQAGRVGAVTIATNMAGRGTDIILGGRREGREEADWQAEHDRVVELGGLHIIGTERHESRRIDNQLRGRAGRQGDPGSSRFYVSFEDDVMRRFAPEWLPGMMTKLGMDDETPIEHKWVTKAIETAQSKVEGYNFDIRKNLVEYDDVMNKHRDVIYQERRKILEGADIRANVIAMVEEELVSVVDAHVEGRPRDEWDLDSLFAQLNAILPLPADLTHDDILALTPEEIRGRLLEYAREQYEAHIKLFEPLKGQGPFGDDPFGFVERQVMLQTIDILWVEHLTAMEEMRQGIGLQAYGQNDPLVMYKREAHDMLEQLKGNIRNLVARNIFHQAPVRPPQAPPAATALPAAAPTDGNGAQAAAPPVQMAVTDGSAVPAQQPVPLGAAQGRAPARAPIMRENREAPTADGAAPAQRGRSAVAARTPGRNEPCFCGSGRKYKKCHGAGL
ncbi:MAG TPA: SEC-C metal-binding domain-containing protein, partial [Dehalococcoidia bacterium]|nr:SEC-C metal-binding domain-containing protein [Dehalococcoidia bacterium]